MDFKSHIASLISIPGIDKGEAEALITPGIKDGQGDYCLPCFKFAKKLSLNPMDAANKIAANLKESIFIIKTECVAGYINFYINYAPVAKEIVEEIFDKGAGFGVSNEGANKTICIDYSSINIAKPFHIGHLSTTVIGGALYRIYKFLGYNVVGINHLGDYGTQFGKLILAYKKWSSKEAVQKDKMQELLRIYVKFHEEAKKDPNLDIEARAWFKKIEQKDPESLGIFEFFKSITLDEVKSVYEMLDITFDSYNGESFYNDKMQGIIDELKEKNLLKQSEAAYVVDLEEYNMPPCLILKADGATLYATRDLAAADYRFKTYNFCKCLYVVAYQQNLHFKQVFKVLELMGKSYAKDCEHIAFGMVSLEDGGAMSTRQGNFVFLKDVIQKSIEKSLQIIKEKNPDLADKENIAKDVGVGAVIFSALINNRIKDIVFSYDRVLNFDGETCPYVQYTYARCNSVLCKSDLDFKCYNFDSLQPQEVALIKLLSQFKQILKDVINKNEPSFLTRYLIDLCQYYNKFYFDLRIISDNKEDTKKRLAITKAVMTIIKNGLKLLGINTVEKM